MKTATFKGAGATPFGAGAVKPVKTCHCCVERFLVVGERVNVTRRQKSYDEARKG